MMEPANELEDVVKHLVICSECRTMRTRAVAVCEACGYNVRTGLVEPVIVEPTLRRVSVFDDVIDAFAVQLERMRQPRASARADSLPAPAVAVTRAPA